MNLLALILDRLGRQAEIEKILRRAIVIEETAGAGFEATLAESLARLADLLNKDGKPEEAEPLAKRALALLEAKLGPDDPDVARALIRLSNVFLEENKAADAAAGFGRAVAIRQKAFGADDQSVGGALGNLARAFVALGQNEDAVKVLKEALRIQIVQRGEDHPSVGKSFNVLGQALSNLGRFVEAEDAFARALTIREGRFGKDHPDVAETLVGFGEMALKQRRFQAAFEAFRRAAGIFVLRSKVRSPEEAADRPGNSIEIRAFEGQAEAAFEVADADPAQRGKRLTDAYQGAQWSTQSRTGLALAQMTERFAKGNSELAASLRAIQLLTRTRADLEQKLIEALAGDQKSNDKAKLIDAVGAADASILDARAGLAKLSPEFAELSDATPLSIAESQKALGPDEALISYMVNDDHIMVFAVTREKTAWLRSPIGKAALAEKITRLRAALDTADKPAATGGKSKPEFDLALANELYRDVLGPVDEVIKDKPHLIIVPAAALTSLPFQLLVGAPPADSATDRLEALKSAPWLIRSHALSVLPTVSALKLLRRLTAQAEAPLPFLGFGNPNFAHGGGGPRALTRGVEGAEGFARFFRAGRADLDALSKGLASLPETADELKAVARSLGTDDSAVLTKDEASEAEVKQLSKSGDLANYRVLHFATHGLIAGEVGRVSQGLAEPALALSLPDEATAEDDGLLTASEVAELKINPDFVVLSACNTASGDTPNAEALSGLARSFFFAGAKALLVSHWYVNSKAAVALVTGTFAELGKDKGLGKAEALRRATLAYIENAKTVEEAGPTSWAPFVLVGDGAATASVGN